MSGQQQGGGESVWINDVVMRDGLQMEPVFVPTSEKVALIDEIGHCGLNRIEATSFTSAKAIPALSDAEAVMHEIERVPGVRYAALVLNRRGAERALECGVDELNLGVSASETHNLANTRMTRAQAVRALLDITAFCRDRLAIGVSIATAFGCPMEGAIDIDSVLDIGNQFVAAGVRGITLCDTTGMANPRQVKAVCGALAARWRGIELTLHLHNTRGMGLANVVAGLDAGIRHFDASLGGLGGCPFAPGASGNICTEDLVHMLDAMGYATGVDLERLIACARRMPGLVGHGVPGQVQHAGAWDHRFPPPADLEATRERALARELSGDAYRAMRPVVER
ncbi:pyruvate carboxyltransferase [Paraburkholderia atlantica]|uniref:Pyruvate carboxyltransferase n=1 Tax=Paraburkholderia atlantica TaxID=2654982 RepID=D5WKG2_PARAM|nr:hydroxymethylglutaryl-CoA lyase [Paraburkholderia atlantica]ADG19708.1 pyruvate carboxyltransferase [Paraburkholderia atlantica]